MFDTACDLIENYGIEDVSGETLYKIGNFLLEKLGNVHDVLLLDICFKSFLNGQYNEKMVSYLNDNFNGTSDEMYHVWKACNELEIDKMDISERIIAQMLFCSQQDEQLEDYYRCLYLLSKLSVFCETAYCKTAFGKGHQYRA